MKLSKTTDLISAAFIFAAVCTSCGSGGGEDLSFANPEWRTGMSEAVLFPLAEVITLTVGLDSAQADLPNPARTWLENKTNIKLEYVSVPSSPGEVELGAMMRAGNLPDLMKQSRLDYAVDDSPSLFVDFLQFRHLTPEFNKLLQNDEAFRHGITSRLTADGKLFSLGVYDPTEQPYSVSLAYRQDVFADSGFFAETWQDLYTSLATYKADNPDSYPFGLASETLHYNLPSMFGSGLDERNIVYFDLDTTSWVAGPFEPEFKEYVYYMSTLFEEGIVIPDLFSMRDEDMLQFLAQPDSLVALVNTGTGVRYQGLIDNYGDLTESGSWNGMGAWYAPLPLPKNERGNTGTMTTELFSQVDDGWMVYNQSEHVAEAISFADLLLSEEAALVMEYGPEGILWNYSETADGKVPRMIDEIRTGYNPDGESSYREYMKTSNLSFGIPMMPRTYDPVALLGLDTDPYYRYFIDTEIGTYLRQGALPFQPGMVVDRSPDFQDETAGLRVGLQTEITSWVAQFIVGQKSLGEYDAFLQLLEKRGLADLAQTFNEKTDFPKDTFAGR